MKFAYAALAFAAIANAQCYKKSGQIQVLDPLVKAWKTYNFQLSKNAAIDVKIAAANAEKASKDAVISGAHADVAASHATAEGAAQSDVDAEKAAALAAQAAKYDAATADVGTAYDSAVAAAQSNHDSKVAAFQAQIAVLNGKKTDASTRNSGKVASVAQSAVDKTTGANQLAQHERNEISSNQARRIAKYNAQNTNVNTRYSDRLYNDVSKLNSKYAGINAKIEAKKYDTAATLAQLDTAGAGGVSYSGDCLVPVSKAIDMVKGGAMPNEIWTRVLINGE